MEPERRRSSRIAVGDGGSSALLRGTVPAVVRDISAAGVGLEVDVLLEPGVYALTALFRGLSVATPVRITRCRLRAPGEAGGIPGDGAWVAGGELLWRDAADAAALRRWLLRREAAPF
jgi:hypothetical protein